MSGAGILKSEPVAPGKNTLPGASGKPEPQKPPTQKSATQNPAIQKPAPNKAAISRPQDGKGQVFPQKASLGQTGNRSPLSNVSIKTALHQNHHIKENADTLPVQTVPAREVFMQTAAAMGFPKDSLSLALLAFARFFSISLSPALMGALRRDILATGKQSSPGTAEGKAGLEADALAACLALDKGAALSPETLERFSRYISILMPPDPNFHQKGSGEKDEPDRDEIPAAGELKEIAEEQASNEGFLDYLNALPGKNGRHWAVYPFNIKLKGTEISVILRLLKRGPSSLEQGEHAIADIAGPNWQWRFFLEKKAGKYSADIRVFPAISNEALDALSKEANGFLGKNAAGKALFGDFSGFDKILLRNGEEASSWVDDMCNERLPLIDEEV